jgi:hypothetical protein
VQIDRASTAWVQQPAARGPGRGHRRRRLPGDA